MYMHTYNVLTFSVVEMYRSRWKNLALCGVLFLGRNVNGLSSVLTCSSCNILSSTMPFCGDLRTKFPICIGAVNATEQDTIAAKKFQQYKILYANDSSECSNTVKSILCATVLPACELSQPRVLCGTDCKNQLKQNCTNAIQQLDLIINTNSSQAQDICTIADEDKCVPLTYAGPNRGAWVAGFVISVVFSFFASVGINLQKKALKQNELTAQENNSAPLPPYRLPLWSFGFFLILTGSLLDFVAFGLAPQSLLAPLAALTLVWNMVR